VAGAMIEAEEPLALRLSWWSFHWIGIYRPAGEVRQLARKAEQALAALAARV